MLQIKKHSKDQYDVVNLSTNKVERSFHTDNIYNIMNAVLNDLYMQHGYYDREKNMIIAPKHCFTIYLDKWCDIKKLANPFHIKFHLVQTKGDDNIASSNQLSLF